MADTISKIDNKDVAWSLIANALRIGYGVILFPFILHMLPSETVAFWTIFSSITALVYLLDFGFSTAFSRNVSYVFSGIKDLQPKGFGEYENGCINYTLLKSLINAMKWLYRKLALVIFILLATLGTAYVYFLLKDYSNNAFEIYIAWGILCVVCTLNIYTLYYDALLQGKGHIKESKIYSIIGSTANIIVAVSLIMLGQGLISIVLAQLCSIVIIRSLSRKKFYSAEVVSELKQATTFPVKNILKVVSPNAVKVGLTSLGGFAVLKSSLFIGSIYLSLDVIASYGITMQVVAIIDSIARSYYLSFLPKICQLRVKKMDVETLQLYIKGSLFAFVVFALCSIAFAFLGDWALCLIGSNTKFLSQVMILTVCLIGWLECNHSIAGGFLLANNEVPYFKAALISGVATVLLLLLLFIVASDRGVWIMILAPGVVQLMYQNWRWPYVLIKSLKNER